MELKRMGLAAVLPALALTLLMLVAIAPSASAATPTWLAPADIGSLSHADTAVEWPPYVAIDQDGDVTAVWTHQEGTELATEAATRPAGGPWEAAVEPTESDKTRGSAVGGVGYDAAGDVTAIWLGVDGGEQVIQAATRPAGGAWEAPVDLSAGGAAAGYPRIAIDAAGAATAVWTFREGTHNVVQAATRPAGGAWERPVDISGPVSEYPTADVAIDAAGDATAVWAGADKGGETSVQTADRPAGGTWTAPVDLSTIGLGDANPSIAVNADGTATAVWEAPNGTEDDVVQSATRPAEGPWGHAVDISADLPGPAFPQVALDEAGDATAVWETSDLGLEIGPIQAATKPAGKPWEGPVELSAGEEAIEPQLAVDPAGDAIAVWRTFGAQSAVQASVRHPGGDWEAPVDLSAAGAAGGEPAIAIDPEGEAAAVWYGGFSVGEDEAIDYTPEVAGYDAAGPQLRSLRIPATGTAGAPTSFSVSPLDVWSGVAQTTWEFGDGATAGGGAVTHTYSAPGTYEVTVTSTDAIGFTSTATGTVAVSPAPAFAAPPPPRHPRVKITHRPGRRHKKHGKGHPRYAFRFYDEEPGATYQCSLDRAPFKPCSSPKVYRHLKPGKHLFRVRSVDADGVASPVRKVRFAAAGKRP